MTNGNGAHAVQHPKIHSSAQSQHLVWFLTFMALLAVLFLAGCGGGGDDDSASTEPQTPGIDPRLLIQAASAPAPGR